MLIDMKRKVKFEIYHGEWSVECGTNIIILRVFKCIKNRVDKLAEWTFQFVYQLLEFGFHQLHVVVSRANKGVWWELLYISNTKEWKVDVNEAKAQSVVEVVIEEEKAQREFDGTTYPGERIPVIVEQIEMEDGETILPDNYVDEFDEEGDPISTEWRQLGFSECSVPETRERELEYMENEVVHRSKYPNWGAVKEVIILSSSPYH
jgi:hypothetical protein